MSLAGKCDAIGCNGRQPRPQLNKRKKIEYRVTSNYAIIFDIKESTVKKWSLTLDTM